MFNYQSTPLEDDIRKLYQEIGIMFPYQLDILEIAEQLEVWIYFMEMDSKAVDRSGKRSMLIDSRLSPPEQWQEFGHEICHLLRQAGKQPNMPENFLSFQETKAESFMYEFCVPSFMLLDLSLPQQKNEIVQHISELFNVTFKFAEKRLTQIERRMLNTQINMEIAATVDAEYQFRRYIGCDYILESSNGTALYNHNRGLIGFIKHKEVY